MIRTLTEDDAATLRALRLRSLREDPDSYLSTYEIEAAEPEDTTRDRLRRTAGSKDTAVLGAFEGNTLVGMLGIVRETRQKASHRAVLWGMYVAPEARNKGAGRALIDQAIARLRAAGVEQAHLTVATSAESARRLYSRAGFVVVGTLKEAMKDGARYIDEELLVLRL